MPEIAEVEHARRRCQTLCVGRKITKVDAQPDPLVIAGTQSEDFVKALTGKTIIDTKRWGKYFVLLMDQEPHIVAHFGMTGDIHFRHEKAKDATWPPRFTKVTWTLENPNDSQLPKVEMAFADARRLGRLRLVTGDPLQQPPINKLGFDPLHNLPEPEQFAKLVQKRSVPIKALLLDQAFSAGVGNWVADEILYQARIHPAQYTHLMTRAQCDTIREQMLRVCSIAVEAEADSSLFPEDWLMTYRWNKGKSKGKGTLPNGHKLAFETVGGRTSAFVPALQKLTHPTKTKSANPKEKPAAAKQQEAKAASPRKRKLDVASDEPSTVASAPLISSRAARYARRSAAAT